MLVTLLCLLARFIAALISSMLICSSRPSQTPNTTSKPYSSAIPGISPKDLRLEYVRIAFVLPASSLMSSLICSGVGITLIIASCPARKGANANPFICSGHATTSVGLLVRAHKVNVTAANTTATIRLEIRIFEIRKRINKGF